MSVLWCFMLPTANNIVNELYDVNIIIIIIIIIISISSSSSSSSSSKK